MREAFKSQPITTPLHVLKQRFRNSCLLAILSIACQHRRPRLQSYQKIFAFQAKLDHSSALLLVSYIFSARRIHCDKLCQTLASWAKLAEACRNLPPHTRACQSLPKALASFGKHWHVAANRGKRVNHSYEQCSCNGL